MTCGIPSRDAAVMTGQSVSTKERARLVSRDGPPARTQPLVLADENIILQWEDRRVFYCTPQTLDNDLKKGSVDPRDIVLAVFGQFLLALLVQSHRKTS